MIFDTLSNLELYRPVVAGLQSVIDEMDRGDIYRLAPGSYMTADGKIPYIITEFDAYTERRPYMFHKSTTVVEIVLSGHDVMGIAWRENRDRTTGYDTKTDTGTLDGDPIGVFHGEEGRFAVFFPGEPYSLGMTPSGLPEKVKRVVFLLKEN